MRFSKTLLAAATMAIAGAASAQTTDVTLVSVAPVPQVFMSMSFNGGVTYGSMTAVEEYIITSTAPAGTFAAFCLDPFQHLTFPWTYGNDGTFTPAVADALSRLFTGAGWQSNNPNGDAITQNFQRVGLGVAVWDIFLDGALDLTGGNVRVADDGFGGAAIAFADAAYAAGNTSLAPYLVRLTDPIKQDLVIAVPEPETYALMIAGLMALGFVSRRRRSS
jgi:hypothetical protein